MPVEKETERRKKNECKLTRNHMASTDVNIQEGV